MTNGNGSSPDMITLFLKLFGNGRGKAMAFPVLFLMIALSHYSLKESSYSKLDGKLLEAKVENIGKEVSKGFEEMKEEIKGLGDRLWEERREKN